MELFSAVFRVVPCFYYGVPLGVDMDLDSGAWNEVQEA